MRPVNLIPPDARRGDHSALRRGPASYVVIAALALGLLAAIALGFTSKQISDRKDDIARLQQEEQQAQVRAESLQAFTNFHQVQETRAATVTSLAQSRFDWNRVLNELARVIPSDVWLVQLSGTVSADVQVEDGPDIEVRKSVPGPALQIIGCAPSQDSVAGFVSDLEDIDGVTRVAVAASERSDENQQAATQTGAPSTTSGSNSQDGDCRTKNFIARFEIVVAFDNVPTPATATSAPSVPPAAPSATGSSGQQLASSSQGSASSSSAPSTASTPGG